MSVTVRMFAVKDTWNDREFFSSIQPSLWVLKMYPHGYDGFFYEVDVSPHPEQSRVDVDDCAVQYWGWLATNDVMYTMVYPSYAQFSMCFAYGYKSEEARGRGKAYRLIVREVERHVDDRHGRKSF